MAERSVENPQVKSASSLVITGSFVHDWTTWADGDDTPSVSGGYGFKTANTSLTTITAFDDPPASGGQEIKILINDGFTRIAHGAGIKLQDAGGMDGYFGTAAPGDTMRFSYDGVSAWWEDTRSVNS